MSELTVEHITAQRYVDGEPSVFVQIENNQKLIVRPGEIVSLEGGNQSGKSTIIGSLLGAHQPQKERSQLVKFVNWIGSNDAGIEVTQFMKMGSDAYSPKSVRDAADSGVVAVFQDDRLIKTMTILEQYQLRHAHRSFLSFVSEVTREKLEKYAKSIASNLPGQKLSNWLRSVPSVLGASRSENDVAKDAKKLLISFDIPGEESFEKILHKFPDEISGGAQAVARLVGALLTENVRYIILDEPFSGVSPKIWRRVIDQVRKTVVEQDVGVLFVSHVPSEIAHWRPVRRYRIANSVIKNEGEIVGAKKIYQSPLRPHKQIGFFEYEDSSSDNYAWLIGFNSPGILIVDRNVNKLKATTSLLKAIKAHHGCTPKTLVIDISGHGKSFEQAQEILDFLATHIQTEKASIFCIGGGTLLNTAGFAASIFLRGRVPTVYIPTTPTAMCDVAIGSKAGVNFLAQTTNGHIAKKHLFGSYFDPALVFSDFRFLGAWTKKAIVTSLAEMIKHGIVQDETLFTECYNLATADKPSIQKLYGLVKQVADLKQDVIAVDFDERNVGRILQYGHLHAHSLERALNFNIPHDKTVWVGCYLDLKLAGGEACWNSTPAHQVLLNIVLSELKGFKIPSNDDLRHAYMSETKREPLSGNGRYSLLKLTEIGQFRDLEDREITEKVVDWEAISLEWNELRIELEKSSS